MCSIRLLLLWSKADDKMLKVNKLICIGQYLKQLIVVVVVVVVVTVVVIAAVRSHMYR